MQFEMHTEQGVTIAEIVSGEVVLSTPQDALDLFSNFYPEHVDGVVVHEHNLSPAFFQLRTRVAGEILQKFVNYGVKLAIVGDFSRYDSKALADFIYESNQGRHFFFAATHAEALSRLAGAR